MLIFRRNKDAEEDNPPDWQWTVRENPAAKKHSDKPSAINVTIPTIPNNRYSVVSTTSSKLESPLTEEPPSVPVPFVPSVSNVPPPIVNGVVSYGPETVLGPKVPEEEPMIVEEPPAIQPPKVCVSMYYHYYVHVLVPTVP